MTSYPPRNSRCPHRSVSASKSFVVASSSCRPRGASTRLVEGHRDLKRLRSTGHNTYIADGGAIRIEDATTKKVFLDKPGQGGRRVLDEEK